VTEPRFLILVIDDHEPNRDLISRRLTRHGHRVVAAASGAEGLRLLEQHPVDLVLLDIMMPGMSGLEVLETIRRSRPASELPVIMATARPESDDLVAALDRGASDYVTKPIQFDILLARLRVQLRERQPASTRPGAPVMPEIPSPPASATPSSLAQLIPAPAPVPGAAIIAAPSGSGWSGDSLAAALSALVGEDASAAAAPARQAASAAPPASVSPVRPIDAAADLAEPEPASPDPEAPGPAEPVPIEAAPPAEPPAMTARPITPITVDVGPAAGRADAEFRARQHEAPTATGEPEVAVPARWVGPGAVIDGRYRLDAMIGQGGFGAVYRAYHLVLETPLAIKFLHQNLVTSGSMLRRFQIEGISACRVRHPNAVAVLDAGSFNGFPFLVMELLEGTQVAQLLEREKIVRLARAASIIGPVCDVLIEAHQAGIIHRDIKPANIMLAQTPRGEVVKVLDFGVARLVDGAQRRPLMSKGESLIGTPQYMAPERLMGQPADARTDIYSVAATLYEMLTAELPWGRSSNLMAQAYRQVRDDPMPVAKHRPDLPGPLGDLVTRAIGRDPAGRPSLQELGDGLRLWGEQFTEPEWPPPGIAIAMATYTPTLLLEEVVESQQVPERPLTQVTSPELPASRARVIADVASGNAPPPVVAVPEKNEDPPAR
jgi:CheY-like chemotaxis protein